MSKAKINSEVPQKFIPVGLKRQISVAYTSPDGRLTSDDPNSYVGDERVAYQDALLSQHPNSGYADGILEARQKSLVFLLLKRKKLVRIVNPPRLRAHHNLVKIERLGSVYIWLAQVILAKIVEM